MTSFAGVDLDGVKAELLRFVQEATPRNGSGNGVITTMSYAKCGRPRAIELAERIRPILDALYAENPDPFLQPAQHLRRMLSAGRLGRKSGQGFYDYTKR